MNSSIQKNVMRHFLLGELRDEDATQLEIDLLADDERFEQMQEAENYLVDDFIRDRLPRAQRERFESHYLASPIHLKRVAFARQLIGKADQTRADPDPVISPIAGRRGFLERLGIWPLGWKYAYAALILLLAAGTFWLLRERSRLQAELTQVRTQREAPTGPEQSAAQQIADVRDQNEKMKSELEKSRAEKVVREERASASRSEKAQPPKILSVMLSPTLVRSNGDTQILSLADSDLVRLQLRVSPSESRRFSVTISTVEGEQIWKQQPIKPGLDRGGNVFIIASVPASKLPAGDYILTLTALNPPATQEEINRYFFRVLRK